MILKAVFGYKYDVNVYKYEFGGVVASNVPSSDTVCVLQDDGVLGDDARPFTARHYAIETLPQMWQTCERFFESTMQPQVTPRYSQMLLQVRNELNSVLRVNVITTLILALFV